MQGQPLVHVGMCGHDRVRLCACGVCVCVLLHAAVNAALVLGSGHSWVLVGRCACQSLRGGGGFHESICVCLQ